MIYLTEANAGSLCYMIRVDKKSEERLRKLQKELELDGKLVDDFHNTIRYIKTQKNADFLIGYLEGCRLPILKAKTVGFDIFGKRQDTLVMRLESENITKWFKKFDKFATEKNYPKSDFPTYKPHISLTEKEGITKPKWKSEYSFEITFEIHYLTVKMADDSHKKIWEMTAKEKSIKECIREAFLSHKGTNLINVP
jgi:hypothetical protein